MEIKDVIDKNLVVTHLNCKTKDEVFRKLSEVLLANHYISDVKDFIEDIYKRESEGSTGIGNYIAIPHSKSQFVNKIGVVIGINRLEIPWESLDGKGVKIVILFAVGSDTKGAQKHLKLLSLFARKLGNDEVVEKLLAAQSVDDVVNAFA
ncbi:PTS sugar transporter subunit IIA [Streptococcus dentiloxodontae]